MRLPHVHLTSRQCKCRASLVPSAHQHALAAYSRSTVWPLQQASLPRPSASSSRLVRALQPIVPSSAAQERMESAQVAPHVNLSKALASACIHSPYWQPPNRWALLNLGSVSIKQECLVSECSVNLY